MCCPEVSNSFAFDRHIFHFRRQVQDPFKFLVTYSIKGVRSNMTLMDKRAMATLVWLNGDAFKASLRDLFDQKEYHLSWERLLLEKCQNTEQETRVHFIMDNVVARFARKPIFPPLPDQVIDSITRKLGYPPIIEEVKCMVKHDQHGGLGVFAAQRLVPGDVVTRYPVDSFEFKFGQEKLQAGFRDELEQYATGADVPDVTVMGDPDLFFLPAYCGHMINDRVALKTSSLAAQVMYEKLSVQHENVKLNTSTMEFRATRVIEVDEELYWSYGAQYWLCQQRDKDEPHFKIHHELMAARAAKFVGMRVTPTVSSGPVGQPSSNNEIATQWDRRQQAFKAVVACMEMESAADPTGSAHPDESAKKATSVDLSDTLDLSDTPQECCVCFKLTYERWPCDCPSERRLCASCMIIDHMKRGFIQCPVCKWRPNTQTLQQYVDDPVNADFWTAIPNGEPEYGNQPAWSPPQFTPSFYEPVEGVLYFDSDAVIPVNREFMLREDSNQQVWLVRFISASEFETVPRSCAAFASGRPS